MEREEFERIVRTELDCLGFLEGDERTKSISVME